MAFWNWNSTWENVDSGWHWTLKFAWLPAKMDNDNYIWLKEYYHGVRGISGPGTPVFLHQYITSQEFIWQCLTQR